MSIGKSELFLLYFRTKVFLFKEQIFVIARFYKNLSFFFVDFLFFFFYLPLNPYRICRKFQEIYGETPLTTMAQIVQECRIGPEDLFLELGSGRGRGAFWLKNFVHCSVIAVEKIPFFIRIAKKIAFFFPERSPQFFCEDFLQTDLRKASVIYLYGTCLQEAEIEMMIEKFSLLKEDTKIITISYPLSDYAPQKFHLKKSFSLSFPWGEATAFLQTPKRN